jgi:Flp pilus assembly pilin Flp
MTKATKAEDMTEVSSEEEIPPRRSLRELGAGLVEYTLLLALIAIVCLGAVTAFGGNNEGGINRSADSIVNAGLP